MRCPYCGTEMTKGTFRSRGKNYFLPDGQKLPWLYSAKAMTKRNAILLPPDFLDISDIGNWPVAYACTGCRKIVIDY